MGGLGGLINSITGASSSARQQNQYAVGMANLNFEQQKQMLIDGPSWQMQGYAKAGLNPALGMSSGLSTGGAGGNGTGGAGAGGGLAALSAIADMYNNTRATSANTKLIDAQTLKTIAETKGIPEQVKAQALTAQAAMMGAKASATNAKTNQEGMRWKNGLANEKMKQMRGGKIAEYLGNFYMPDFK